MDCSGSMGGGGIASARRALHGVLDALAPGDEASLSRFGSQVEHALGPGPCSDDARSLLHRVVDATDASLGGTEMAAALRAVFGLWHAGRAGSDGDAQAQAVLLPLVRAVDPAQRELARRVVEGVLGGGVDAADDAGSARARRPRRALLP
ncbi:MAG: VWA domain-containing protein [Burkholderiales bacterium]|nr:VWA domain-containing protein [Burkholderiales bacterium]